jgi:competence protein ComEA
MLKKLFAIFAMLYAAMAFAAVDVNNATAADLDAIKGIGPAISSKILDERKKGAFKDWDDMITRVNGIGETNAAKFSAEGMTVGGQSFKGVMAKPTAKKEDKPMAKDAKDSKPAAAAAAAPAKDEKKADAKPAAAADAKADMKADDKEAKAKAKEEAKAAKAAEKAADKEAKAKAKEEAKAAKAADKEAKTKADSAKPAASAAKK